LRPVTFPVVDNIAVGFDVQGSGGPRTLTSAVLERLHAEPNTPRSCVPCSGAMQMPPSRRCRSTFWPPCISSNSRLPEFRRWARLF